MEAQNKTETGTAAVSRVVAAKKPSPKPTARKSKLRRQVTGSRNTPTPAVISVSATSSLEKKDLLAALVALRKGDFNVRLPVDYVGVDGKLADTFNDIIEFNQRLSRELERISRVVGKEGKISQRVEVGEVTGLWNTAVNSVNNLIGDLAYPINELARVIGAVAKGDLAQSVALETDGKPLQGEFLRTAKTVNTMVTQLASFASEVTRVAREVGTEGKLGGQAKVRGVAGTWKDLTDNVNLMASNLTSQVRNIATVTTAVANGDLAKKITVDVKGEFLELKNTINTMVDQLRSFASEVTRVAREVGTEGKLGGQARVEGVSGTWKDLTDNVNSMARNLTAQVRNIAAVTTAVANGDLSKKITVNVRGEILELKDTINTMVDQLSSFASEVTRVAREVGTEGKLGGQAQVKGVAGTWKDLTDSVNLMAANLTGQVRNIADVTKAVAKGDLSKKITVDVKGEILELKNTVNTMVDQLSSFAAEVTRVAREVGSEGKLGVQAEVKGVAGTWKDLTDNVNVMASNLTVQLRDVSKVATAIATGDLSQKITVNVKGEILQIKDTINTMVDQLSSFASEVTRVAREVGSEGKLGVQAEVRGVAGTWKDLTDNVNVMASNLTVQLRDVSKVATAIATGDLGQKITVNVKGEILQIKNTINTMVDQLSSFAAEVTRVAREVGTEGKLGGQAEVKGVAGTWKDLTDSVNFMARNLTDQVRNIADVTKAVAAGDLSKKITVDVKGEILELKNTINTMVDQLSSFASEVTRVAREVGTEGKLGGQAEVKGVAGTWKDLTDSVNFMAGNLTGQVRNIADVTKAVAAGDLSKKITVNVRGEIAELKDTINTMVDQLRSFASEVTRVAREVGTEGKLGGQAEVKGVAGTWKDLTDSVNFMAGNLTGQVRNIADVTKAVAAGDLSKKITVDVKGEILELKNTINTMVDQLSSFASEVTRVAREVGTEGKLGGQAEVKGVAGTWKDLTDSVNFMARNLTDQVRNIADVTKAVAAGDLSKKITVDVKGEILELKNTINTMVDQLSSFASEVTRVAREVGTEGKLGGQADVRGVAGTWKDLTDNVNFMANNLTDQVRNIADVTKAVAAGDLSKKITVNVRGEILELKDTINTMVDQLRSFASEVTRVAREVGTEGKLGGQADVKGVAGTWKDLTDNVNFMANNLTDQVRNIADVTKAVANGDLSKKITVNVRGEILELKDTINTMVDQLRSFASEVTRVAREVGTEGKLGGQADVKGISGTWKDLTDSVNFMARNLTDQVRNIADVTKAVAAGDLSKKITVDVKGEILELKNTVNTMVDQLSSFASEVTRVAREVGTEGKLGGQAEVKGVAGTWKDLTDSVNFMAGNLTGQVRNIAAVTTAVANGDLSKKITVDVKGEILELKDTINTMVDQLRSFASEVTRVAREVGTEGKLGGQADVKGVAGTWKDLTDNVNFMASNLTAQVRNIADVTKAVAAGDLSKKITVDVKGEILDLKNTVNTMVDQLRAFAAEVTRVAREVGTEGKLGGQAEVQGVSGTWKDLTDNVNFMAGNLTNQVRGIAKVVTAVANGDLKRKLTVEAKGEIAELADTINGMTDTLAIFADQVTTVAREVGVEGKLGGQASVPGAAGTWRDLTDNVNQLAANLTTQVRAIAEVATAVTKGDLTRAIQVEAQGEVAVLKDTINEMIRNLKDTTLKNSEQDWLKTNLAKFTRMLQGQKDLITVGRLILSELAPVVSAQHGVFYMMDNARDDHHLKLLASYAYRERKTVQNRFVMGESLVGQCALEKEKILLTNVPANYIQISSGLGEAKPLNLIVLPVLFEGQVKAVIELASFDRFSPTHQTFLDQLTESIGIVLNTIEANSRTEDLLKQSQSLAKELQSQQEELQQTNAELEDKAKLLAMQNDEVERKNREVEQARQALEEKASQLALTSKYKSEFLANMSHELRTPLNSLLLLARQLVDNPEKNLTGKQVEFAKIIHGSGNDLLALINDILDLSKIESGTVSVDVGDLRFNNMQDYVERTFRHVADSKGLEFHINMHPNLPRSIQTDVKRLQQIIKNLLSNAFKFTEKGHVVMEVQMVRTGWTSDQVTLNQTGAAIAFSVSDTGIGIAPEKQAIIFEAFQQADGSTSRKYGGTGLGLAISREIARLLGGEIQIASKVGEGSVFTLYLPQNFMIVRPSRQGQDTESSLASLPTHNPSSFPSAATVAKALPLPAPVEREIEDDRSKLDNGDRVVLIVEDDYDFANFLFNLAHEQGMKAIVETRGLKTFELVKEYQPHSITLDLSLPDIDGWKILERLKDDSNTRHIPIYIISGDDDRERGLRQGAMDFLTKPVTKEALEGAFDRMRSFIDRSVKNLLVVEDDQIQRQHIVDLIGDGDVQTTAVSTGVEALEAIKSNHFDCLVLDLGLPDMNGFAFIEEMRKTTGKDIPIIVYTARELTRKEQSKLQKLAQSIIIKDVRSPERLLDETSLFLHRNAAQLPEPKRQMLEKLHQADAVLAGKKVLIVDDDIRNIFALTSILERYNLQLSSAENGHDAIENLDKNPDMDVVLMDIMMPEMDGYDTIKHIRKNPKFKSLPIIAVTAKAMKGDRAKCIEAGASDYLSKPVDPEQLLSTLRAWLYR
ncbi:MAG: sensor histidine kinase/response regulator [Verrucomicrobiales bacterium]|nr:sensor histidine kinase/response regulator [Verrucomicrobiales bacterium]